MIRFQDVHVRWGERVVLDGISLDLTERRVGLIGANGSGKSTLARTVNGLVRPDEGSVAVDGLDVAEHTAQVRRRVGFLFADPASQILMPTVAEDVALSLRGRGLSRDQVDERVGELLREYGLSEHADHPAQLLSSGQQQQLAFAAVLASEPSVVVADEPSTLLDLANVLALRRRLAALDQQVLLLTHHLELVDDFDRVVHLEDGRVVDDGPPDRVVAGYVEAMRTRAAPS